MRLPECLSSAPGLIHHVPQCWIRTNAIAEGWSSEEGGGAALVSEGGGAYFLSKVVKSGRISTISKIFLLLQEAGSSTYNMCVAMDQG